MSLSVVGQTMNKKDKPGMNRQSEVDMLRHLLRHELRLWWRKVTGVKQFWPWVIALSIVLCFCIHDAVVWPECAASGDGADNAAG